MELRWAVCLYRVCIRSGSETTVARSQREVQAGCGCWGQPEGQGWQDDRCQCGDDASSPVQLPPRQRCRAQPGREQRGCWWKCSSSLGLALWLQQVKWSKWDFVDSLEPCCLTCQSLVSPLLWAHVSYSEPWHDLFIPRLYNSAVCMTAHLIFLLISYFSQVKIKLNVNYVP